MKKDRQRQAAIRLWIVAAFGSIAVDRRMRDERDPCQYRVRGRHTDDPDNHQAQHEAIKRGGVHGATHD